MSDWRFKAACRGEDVDLFFPIGVGPRATQQADEAKSVCRSCLVRQECLEDALKRPEKFGIFGGLDADERLKLRRNRMRRAAA